MKKLLSLLVLLASTISFGQVLTLDQLIELRNLPTDKSAIKLVAKDYQIVKFEEPTDDALGVVHFKHGKTSLIGDYSESFISLYFDDVYDNRVTYTTANINTYNNILAKIKSYNAKMIDSGVGDGYIYQVYQGKSYTYSLWIESTTNYFGSSINAYKVTIYANSDYNRL